MVIWQAGKIFFSVIYCDYVIRLYKIENRYFLQVWSWQCCYHISSIYHTKFENILCDILETMVIWVAVLPRVDQLAKVMPNFWRAVYFKQHQRVVQIDNAAVELLLSSTFFMMTSSNGNIFRVTGPLCGEFTGPGEFPTQRPVTRSFDVYLWSASE